MPSAKWCEHAEALVSYQRLIEPANALATHCRRTMEISVFLTLKATHTCTRVPWAPYFEFIKTSLAHQVLAINKHNLCAASSHARNHMLGEEVPEVPAGLWDIQDCPAHEPCFKINQTLCPHHCSENRQVLLPTKKGKHAQAVPCSVSFHLLSFNNF